MSCDRIDLKAGGAIYICSRGRRTPKRPCSVAGCGAESTHQCDFKLSGAKAGKTCDRYLCAKHAVRQAVQFDNRPVTLFAGTEVRPQEGACAEKADTVDYCPTHAKIAETNG